MRSNRNSMINFQAKNSAKSNERAVIDNTMFVMPSFNQKDKDDDNTVSPSSSIVINQNASPIPLFRSPSFKQDMKPVKQQQPTPVLGFKSQDEELISQMKLQRRLSLVDVKSTVIIKDWQKGNEYIPRCVLDQNLDADLKIIESEKPSKRHKADFWKSCNGLFDD
ncbi:hypothetical protein SS50377_26608 [Spironucleus salmonicida]|uniref:Uncharacterized protein n=1 Tax=Spironucleus salmonicida TaxID=348837 RepID=V6LLA6_9EUKA|nr:hypothetical protein SS50377_26608 [Spironucleus salmonicida]|eukprot:EST41459.1 Hypothetical protein SS50377_19178 [Spironucleus salmonicida]